MTKQELRGPDAFQKSGGEARDWFQGHLRTVLIAGGLVLLVGVAVALSGYLAQRNQENAARELSHALRLVERPVEGDPQAAAATSAEEPPFKNSQEKNTAIVKAMEDFRAHHKDSPAENSATLALADAQLHLAHYDDAVKLFGEYLKDAPADDLLRTSATEGMGYSYEAKHDLDQAMQAFEQMSKESKTEFLAGMGMYHRARILALKGQKQAAADAFSEVQGKFPAATAGHLAGERLALLSAEGVKPALVAAPTVAAGGADAGR